MSGEGGSLAVTATVSGGTATIAPISDSAIAAAVGSDGGSASLTIDLTSLGDAVDTVSIPDATLDKLADALEAHEGNDSLTVKTAHGSVKLNENALSAVADAGNAGNVALTVKSGGESGLNAAQRAAVADKNVAGTYSLGVTSDGKDVGALGGGFAEVSVPFVPEAGTDAPDYRVYRVDESGSATLVPSAVHDGKLTARSNRLDDIVIVYEPTSEAFSDVAHDAYYTDTVAWALANGITNGMDAGVFAPDADCTRAQIVTFLYRDFVR